MKENTHEGYLSAKAVKRLRTAINWLCVSSDWQKIKSHFGKGIFYFKINFITLTLPFSQLEISDQEIKRELLNPFLQLLRNRYNFDSYVWKAEAQKNGNIHFHITSNTYIPHEELRFFMEQVNV